MLTPIVGELLTAAVGGGYQFATGIGLVVLLLLGLWVSVLLEKILDTYTTHRGHTHSSLFGVGVGILTTGGIWWIGLGRQYYWMAILGSVIGVAAHIYVGDR